MQLVLEIDRGRDLDVLIPLLERLQIRFITQNDMADARPNTSKLTTAERKDALRIVAAGCDTSNFGDAVAYQKSIRSDRPLPFRD